jgi:hypothetical protein
VCVPGSKAAAVRVTNPAGSRVVGVGVTVTPGPSLVDECQAQVAAQSDSDAEGHYYASDGVVMQLLWRSNDHIGGSNCQVNVRIVQPIRRGILLRVWTGQLGTVEYPSLV